jgi:hypothetical protein
VGWLCSLCHHWRLDKECNQSCFEVRMIKPAMDLDLHSWKVQSNEKGNLIHWQGMTTAHKSTALSWHTFVIEILIAWVANESLCFLTQPLFWV